MKQVLSLTAILFTITFSNIMAQTVECKATDKDILAGEHGDIFQKELNGYTPNEELLAKGNFKGVNVKVVLGNWCEDSQREVPRLMKILETAPLEKVTVEYYLVNREKFCPDPEVQKLDAKYVPAIIFYRDGKEIGRIIESPEVSLEANMVKIVGK